MITYKTAGVDKEEGYKSVGLIKDMVKRTYSKNVLTELGSFGALYELGKYDNPVLVSGTDGVGTKLKIAFALNKYDTIGIDCVAMCVNDILCHGAKPLFFLDYLACGKLDAEVAAQIVLMVMLLVLMDCQIFGSLNLIVSGRLNGNDVMEEVMQKKVALL